MKTATTIFALLALLFTTGCEDTTTNAVVHDEHSEFQETIEHVEEHFVKGPFADVELAATAADAPDVSKEHTCYHVKGSGKGFVSYAIELEAGETEADRMIFIDQESVTISVQDAQGEEVHAHAVDLDEVTTTVIKKGAALHELPAGVYTIVLEGVTESISMVIAHGGDEHAH